MRILLTGDYGHCEFRDAVAWLAERAELERTADLLQAAERVRSSPAAPRLIVVAQSRPGQFAPAEIERLYRAAPLARLAALLGSWCEGEARSGRPWPGVERIYWHQWQPRLAALLDAQGDNLPAAWRLPRTASAAERLLAGSASPPVAHRGVIGIVSLDAEGYAAFADACTVVGYATVWLNPRRPTLADGLDAVLFSGSSLDAGEAALLRQWSERLRPAPVIALLSFPRTDDVERCRAAGARSVLSKPLISEDLYRELERLLQSHRQSTADASAKSTSAA